MSADLSNEANELVREGRSALRATASDKERIFAALQARIQHEASGDGNDTAAREAAATDAAATNAKHAATKEQATPTDEASLARLNGAKLGKFALVTGGLVAAFVVLSGYLSRQNLDAVAPVPVGSTMIVESVAAVTGAGTSVESEPSIAVDLLPIASETKQTSARPVPTDSLAAEAALLSQAEKALHNGNLNRALQLTTEHRKKFPKGVMIQERVNIRMQSLCGLGRVDEADKEYARFRHLPSLQPGQACRR